MSRDLGSQLAVVKSLAALATIALAIGRFALAAKLLGATEAIRDSIGAPIQPVERSTVDAMVDTLRNALGEAAFQSEFAAGLALSANEANDVSLSLLATLALPDTSQAPLSDRAGPGLTPRELDVLRLLVEGHSNAEIAANLSISNRTVRNHLSNIFAKLKVESRTAAATFALRNDLV